MIYTVRRMAAPDWSAIERVAMKHQGWVEPCAISAWAQACHDGENMYIRLEAEEAPIRATMQGPLCDVWCDSCLEFFFAPELKDERYINMEWNPLGSLYLGFGGKLEKRVRQIVEDQYALFMPKPFRTEKGWGIEFRLPADYVRTYFPDFAFEGEKNGNFYKCGDDTVIPHFLAWSDMHCDTPAFHRRWDFGTLIFE